VPNMFRNSVGMDDLRQHERFIALPEVQHVRVLSPANFRHARAWDERTEIKLV
jgi:hypothetical protein